jgi:hypothetical protein
LRLSPRSAHIEGSILFFTGKIMKVMPIAIALSLCLTSAAAMAQTPAQDAANVAKDRQNLEDAKAAVEADKMQQNTDMRTGDRNAIQADTDKLIQDSQAVTYAKDKLGDDKESLQTDKDNFNAKFDDHDSFLFPQKENKPSD